MSKHRTWERGGPPGKEATSVYRESVSDPMVMEPVASFRLPKDADDAVSCVNACAGLNPEALPALLGAVQWVLDDLTDARENAPAPDKPEYDSIAALRAALGAIKEGKDD